MSSQTKNDARRQVVTALREQGVDLEVDDEVDPTANGAPAVLDG